jgi:hypothetical protein
MQPAASYGRGLWKLSLTNCPKPTRPIHNYQLAEPLMYWKGALVPVSQIHDPDVCPVCGYFLVDHGDITEVNVSKGTNEISGVALSGGNIKGYTYERKAITELPFRISTFTKNFDAGEDQELGAMLGKGYRVKEFTSKGNCSKALSLRKKM